MGDTKDTHVADDSAQEVVKRQEERVLPLFGEVHCEWAVVLWILQEWKHWKIMATILVL